MIAFTKAITEKMIGHSKREFPNEACGILAGEDGAVSKIYEMTNADKSPSSYFMDAREQFKAMKDIRALGLEMLGIYHSHVASQAYPSAHDVKLAFYPEASYVIITLEDKGKPGIRSFKIKEGKISEEEIRYA
ncbi:MAG: M67 family metallopeptidase [Candidatus Omnitrophica bacterium]|nr:M67 family metallopeptidase [Candidatus Omnitrophota bacterium]